MFERLDDVGKGRCGVVLWEMAEMLDSLVSMSIPDALQAGFDLGRFRIGRENVC